MIKAIVFGNMCKRILILIAVLSFFTLIIFSILVYILYPNPYSFWKNWHKKDLIYVTQLGNELGNRSCFQVHRVRWTGGDMTLRNWSIEKEEVATWVRRRKRARRKRRATR